MAWDVMSGMTKTAWDVMSGAIKTAWDVLSGVANLCGMFCPGCQKMAWDVLSRDVLSGSHYFFIEKISSSLKLFSGHFFGQSFIKTVRGPYHWVPFYKNS